MIDRRHVAVAIALLATLGEDDLREATGWSANVVVDGPPLHLTEASPEADWIATFAVDGVAGDRTGTGHLTFALLDSLVYDDFPPAEVRDCETDELVAEGRAEPVEIPIAFTDCTTDEPCAQTYCVTLARGEGDAKVATQFALTLSGPETDLDPALSIDVEEAEP